MNPPDGSHEDLPKHVTADLQMVARSVRTGEIDDVVITAIGRLILHYRSDLSSIAVGLGRVRAARAVRVAEYIGRLEDRLAQVVQIDQMTDKEEIKALINYFRNQEHSDLDYILKLVQGDKYEAKGRPAAQPPAHDGIRHIAEDRRDANVGGAPISQEGRERIRLLIDGVRERIRRLPEQAGEDGVVPEAK